MNNKILVVSLSEEELKKLIKSSMRETLKERISKQQIKELMTFKEVLSLLNISASTLNSWKRDGKLPYHKLNGRIYFKYNEIVQSLSSAGNTRARELQQSLLNGGCYV